MTERPTLTDRQRRSLDRLITAHQARIRGLIARFVPDRDAADDLAQEVFVEAIPRCEELAERDLDGQAAYLFGIARNLARQRVRRLVRRRNLQARAALEVVDRLRDEVDEPDDLGDQVDHLRRCLERLGGDARTLVQAHFFEGRPIVEIAKEHGKRPAALRMTLLRVRSKLRECVERRHQKALRKART